MFSDEDYILSAHIEEITVGAEGKRRGCNIRIDFYDQDRDFEPITPIMGKKVRAVGTEF